MKRPDSSRTVSGIPGAVQESQLLEINKQINELEQSREPLLKDRDYHLALIA